MYVKLKGHEVIEPWFESKYAIEITCLDTEIVITLYINSSSDLSISTL